MTDQPPVDNPQSANLGRPVERDPNLLQFKQKIPGDESGSTPVNLKEFQGEQTKSDDVLIQALMQGMKEGRPESLSNQPVVKAQEAEVKVQEPKPPKQQQGFLAPFVNGFNGLLEGIFNALKSLLPMKPQTGAH